MTPDLQKLAGDFEKFRTEILQKVGNGVNELLAKVIRSTNFLTTVRGWRIDAQGNAEFNSGTFKGNFIPDGTLHGRATAQTAANTNVMTATVGAADATYTIAANILVTTSTAHSFSVTVDYTDEGNTARTLTVPVAQLAGTLITAITNVTGAGPYEGVGLTIRAKAATNIVFKTAGTFTTVTYNVDVALIRVV